MTSLKIRREQIIELEIKAETLQKNVIIFTLNFKQAVLRGNTWNAWMY